MKGRKISATGVMGCRIEIREVGLVPYPEALAMQERARDRVIRGRLDGVLFALRHPPTITLGRRAEFADVLISTTERRRLGIELYYSERGGGATFHYPSQAIVYPVVHLERFGIGIQDLVECLCFATICVLREAGIEAQWNPARPGVYVDGAKIASVGLHISKGVTMHGLALNVGHCLEGFSLIVPCKEPGLRVTSLEDVTGRSMDVDNVAKRLVLAIRDRMLFRV